MVKTSCLFIWVVGFAAILLSAVSNLIIPERKEFIQLPDDETEQVGRYTNVRIAEDGYPIISFNDENVGGIRFVKMDDEFRNLANVAIDSKPGFSDNGRFIRLEINPNNHQPYFIYISDDENNSKATMLAFCKDSSCANVETKEIFPGPSSRPSIAFRPMDGFPVIAFSSDSKESNRDKKLMVALCNDLNCSSFRTIDITDEHGNQLSGSYVHIEIGKDNIPVFSWLSGKFTLNYGRCRDEFCSSLDEKVIDDGTMVGIYNFMRLDRDDNPIIIYADKPNGLFKTAYCDDTSCSNPIITVVDNDIGTGDLVYGVFPEVDINPQNDLPIFSYVAQPNDSDGNAQGILKIAQCTKRDCSEFLLQEIVRGGLGFGRDSSMALKDEKIFLTFLDYNNDKKRAYLVILRQQPSN